MTQDGHRLVGIALGVSLAAALLPRIVLVAFGLAAAAWAPIIVRY
jgi:Na+(H+)/acetate symporter ActP